MIIPRILPNAEQVGRHYNDLDTYYRELWGEHVHHGLWLTGRESPLRAVEQLTERIAEGARVAEGDEICDVGCGYGGTSRWLVKERQANVVGFTVSKAQFEFAEQLSAGTDNPSYRLMPWEDNGLEDDSCDAVISIECLTHVPDKLVFFQQIRRVLKPGRRVALAVWMTEPNPRGWRVRWLLEPICREGRLAGMGSAEEYQAIITEAGLEVEVFEDWSRNVRRTWWILARRVVWKLMTSTRYWKALLNSTLPDRVFALTLFRILIGYYIGAMRYGYVVARKPVSANPS